MAGKFYDELEVGMKFKHGGRTVTEMDNVLFSALTMNTQPLHVNEDFASKTEFGQRLVNGVFTFGLVVGLTVAELTEGTIVANLGYDKVIHPNPVFHGDTIYAQTKCGAGEN
jgi:acyl dehydratase